MGMHDEQSQTKKDESGEKIPLQEGAVRSGSFSSITGRTKHENEENDHHRGSGNCGYGTVRLVIHVFRGR